MAAKIERLDSVRRLLAGLEHVGRLKANSSTRLGAVIESEEHARDLALTARLRILLFAFKALGR